MCGKPHKKSSIPRRQSLSSPISNPRDMSNKTTFSPASIKHFRSALHMTPVVTSHQPVTVNGAVNTDLLLSGQGIEEGTGSLLNCLLLPWGLIHQMEKPMADWQHQSTHPLVRLSPTYFISSLSLLLVLFFILPSLYSFDPSRSSFSHMNMHLCMWSRIFFFSWTPPCRSRVWWWLMQEQ